MHSDIGLKMYVVDYEFGGDVIYKVNRLCKEKGEELDVIGLVNGQGATEAEFDAFGHTGDRMWLRPARRGKQGERSSEPLQQPVAGEHER